MIVSMTGFAALNSTIVLDNHAKVQVSISLKSLNSRFFEATCKLPYALSQLETTFIKLLKTKLLRGHIYLTIYMQESQLLKGSIEPSLALIEGYLAAVETVKSKFGLSGELTVEQLLRIPNAFVIQDQPVNENIEHQIINLVQELIAKLQETQIKEGAALANDLTERLSTLQKEIDAIHHESTTLIEHQKSKVQLAVQEIASSGNEDQLAEMRRNALYAMLDKMDIHEEIVRFKSHLKNFNDIVLGKGSEKGKQLDFTLQELGREINTIGAKCSDASIGSRAISIKVELEKAREQVQNIV